MTLKECLKKYNDDDVIFVGAKSSFFFIGNKEQLKFDCSDIDGRFIQLAKNRIALVNEKINRNVKKIKYKKDGVVFKTDAKGIGRATIIPYEIFAKNCELQVANLQAELNEKQDYLKDYMPILDRQVIEEYERKECKDGLVIVVDGCENGRYWFKEEYDTGYVEPEDIDEGDEE